MTSSTPVDIGTLLTRTPDVYGGRLCLAGTRYPVTHVGSQYREGMSAEEIADDYSLPLELVYAGVTYYLANRAAVDAEIEEDDRLYMEAYAKHTAERNNAPN